MLIDEAAILAELKHTNPAVIYLYGSAASGSLRPDSDIDLAYLPQKPVPPLQNFEMQQNLAVRLNCDVDLVDLSRASTVFQAQVIKFGKVLFEGNPRKRAEFEMYTYSDYVDLNERRGPILKAFERGENLYG